MLEAIGVVLSKGHLILEEAILWSSNTTVKISWASERDTLRVEDQEYCTLGLLGINMPLIYGEGLKAFEQLQQELISSKDDESIFS